VDLQTVEVEIAVGDVKSVGTILLLIPDLFHAENEPVKSRQPAIVVGAIRHMSDHLHMLSPFFLPVIYFYKAVAQA
jgi:hypothetical protein